MLTKTQVKYAEFYLEWFNDYLTVACMAEHKGMTVEKTELWISLGRDYHNQFCKEATKERLES